MKVYKYKCLIKDNKSKYIKFIAVDTRIPFTPCQQIQQVIDRFNFTLHPKELPRTLILIRNKGTKIEYRHNWEKSNLITQIKGSNQFDTYKCKDCRITGKRYGLSFVITRDPKYVTDKYNTCI